MEAVPPLHLWRRKLISGGLVLKDSAEGPLWVLNGVIKRQSVMGCLKWEIHGSHFLCQPKQTFPVSACVLLLVVHCYESTSGENLGFLAELAFLRRAARAAGSKAQQGFVKNLHLKSAFCFLYP